MWISVFGVGWGSELWWMWYGGFMDGYVVFWDGGCDWMGMYVIVCCDGFFVIFDVS